MDPFLALLLNWCLSSLRICMGDREYSGSGLGENCWKLIHKMDVTELLLGHLKIRATQNFYIN